MPQNIFRMTNSRLQPCQYPGDARLRNGKFGATQQFFAGQAIGRKTSDQLLYPCAAGTNDVYSVTLSGGPATAGTFTECIANLSVAPTVQSVILQVQKAQSPYASWVTQNTITITVANGLTPIHQSTFVSASYAVDDKWRVYVSQNDTAGAAQGGTVQCR